MDDLARIEKYYKKYISNLFKWVPEGIMTVDLKLLQKLDLLNYNQEEKKDPNLTRYFHVIEGKEKITLHNDQFVVWIIPEQKNSSPVTYALIAINRPNDIHLELAFMADGVYNTSKLVLRVLEKLLFEIQENEDILSQMQKTS